MEWNTVEEYEEYWNLENEDLMENDGDGIGQLMREVARDGKCFCAVMIFHHHLAENDRKELMMVDSDDFVLPLLPDNYIPLETWAELLEASTTTTTSDKSGESDDKNDTSSSSTNYDDGTGRRRCLYKAFSHRTYANPKEYGGNATCGACHASR